jgi:hypothetical protein
VEEVDIGNWVKTTVYIPDLNSEITPPFMEAFLEIQRQLYQFVAFVIANAADSKLLSLSEKDDLLINVRVSPGSSKLEADVRSALKKALPTLLKKLNGKQVATVMVALSLIFGAGWAFSAWLEQQKQIQLAELKSKEHLEALRALTLGTATQAEAFAKLTEALQSQGKIGERALIVLQATNDALLKAASRTPSVEINGQPLTGSDAQSLRTATRRAPTERYSTERVRIVSVDTGDEASLQMVLMDERNDQHRVTSAESLFSAIERPRIFAALESRAPIWVELLFRESDGEVKSVTFLRVTDDPTLARR